MNPAPAAQAARRIGFGSGAAPVPAGTAIGARAGTNLGLHSGAGFLAAGLPGPRECVGPRRERIGGLARLRTGPLTYGKPPLLSALAPGEC